jgi:NTE family protein
VARKRGADIVIAVDISQNVANYEIANLFDVTLQAVSIMTHGNAAHGQRDADVVIRPAVGRVGMMDFTQKKQLMQAGIEAARAAMPQIRQAIADWTAKQARQPLAER